MIRLINFRMFFFSIFLFSLLALEGCVLKDVGRSVQQTVKGEYYLSNKKYVDGRESFIRSIKQNPSDAVAHYYLGRILLAEERGSDALPYLQKAVNLSSEKADYYFWLGVAQGEVGHSNLEKQYYEKALAVNGRHLQALTYLGHKHLEEKKYLTALSEYQKVLKEWPESPSALYNRALIMKKLGRSPEERLAWLAYLDIYPAGPMARRASDNLNGLGDFEYRNYSIGVRTITLRKITFQPFSHRLDSDSHMSLELLGSILGNLKKGTLQVVWYQKNNRDMARKRAKSIKEYILKKHPKIDSQRISLSWFDVPEEMSIHGTKFKNDESVRFFLTR